ncbi:hypothetical protein WT01_03390 [Burkholderia cepacia]|uniref:Uncharacterized protein n=1 Tax=Burkholderia cepacia TaxID=292 RepID=A0A103UR58_BURCE|nr:hypothetical protein [Burkholderia cepacia]KVH40198.1 hypothetical protein WS88_11065 [Burkholderia cepacia]KVK75386.1 hypothetical protein WS90_30330 [Burkholderia cepacia]KVL44790.1 hypothetical protein WT01_03390 [Burkholderia cepacia]
MVNTTRHPYRITDLQRVPIATMTIVQEIEKLDALPDRCCTGRVSVEFEYLESRHGSTARVRKFPFDERWLPLDDASFQMRIGDFMLPPELCCRGIGTLCWSEIHRTLPLPPGFSLLLAGSLSNKDATLTGNIPGKLQTIDNIERRNAFWRRMLDPANQVLVSDANGDGYFRGRFVDPATHASYTPKALATRI